MSVCESGSQRRLGRRKGRVVFGNLARKGVRVFWFDSAVQVW